MDLLDRLKALILAEPRPPAEMGAQILASLEDLLQGGSLWLREGAEDEPRLLAAAGLAPRPPRTVPEAPVLDGPRLLLPFRLDPEVEGLFCALFREPPEPSSPWPWVGALLALLLDRARRSAGFQERLDRAARNRAVLHKVLQQLPRARTLREAVEQTLAALAPELALREGGGVLRREGRILALAGYPPPEGLGQLLDRAQADPFGRVASEGVLATTFLGEEIFLWAAREEGWTLAALRLLEDAGAALRLALTGLRRQGLLQQVQRQRDALAAATSEGLGWVNAHRVLTYANPALLSMLGLDLLEEGQDVVQLLKDHLAPQLESPALLEEALNAWSRDRKGLDLRLAARQGGSYLLLLRPLLVREAWVLTLRRLRGTEEIERLKNEFLGTVTHELRTPLTSILGYTEILTVRSFDPDQTREMVQLIHQQATHLARLIDDLLILSRADRGKLTLNRGTVALRQLCHEVAAELAARTLPVQILVDVPENLPPVLADRDKIRRVLGNLLDNAIKFSPSGAEVILQVREREDPFLEVRVQDHGPGVPPEERSRIFQRFYRGSGAQRARGTGLGLAIAKTLVESHGGRIWVEETPGGGATFCFTLPRVTPELLAEVGGEEG